jgi:ribose/xylose/arabinose/galactoside ABC-type transport system permease subunit
VAECYRRPFCGNPSGVTQRFNRCNYRGISIPDHSWDTDPGIFSFTDPDKISNMVRNYPRFQQPGKRQVFGFLHYSVIIFLGLALFLEFVLNKTPFGRSLFVLGLNEEVGRLSGLLVNRIKIATFTFCGFTAGLAGLIMTSRLNSTSASGAQGMEFDSIIATVLGGTSLFGGSGGTLRTVVGVIVLGILNNLVVLLGVSYEGQFITKGAVFLLVVWLDTITRKR